MVDCIPAACDYECEEEGFMREGCEKSIRPACAGLVPGLEFLADTCSEEDLISKSDHEAHFSGTPTGRSDRPVSLITANGPVQGNKSVKLEVQKSAVPVSVMCWSQPRQFVRWGGIAWTTVSISTGMRESPLTL